MHFKFLQNLRNNFFSKKVTLLTNQIHIGNDFLQSTFLIQQEVIFFWACPKGLAIRFYSSRLTQSTQLRGNSHRDNYVALLSLTRKKIVEKFESCQVKKLESIDPKNFSTFQIPTPKQQYSFLKPKKTTAIINSSRPTTHY